MKRRPAVSCTEYFSSPEPQVAHFQHFVDPIALFMAQTVTKFIQIFMSAMRTCLSSRNGTIEQNNFEISTFFFHSASATNKTFLRVLGITHILNTAEGSRFGQVDTGHLYYRDMPNIRYMGFPMTDHPSTDISRYFYIAAKFIENGINSGGRPIASNERILDFDHFVYFLSPHFSWCQ